MVFLLDIFCFFLGFEYLPILRHILGTLTLTTKPSKWTALVLPFLNGVIAKNIVCLTETTWPIFFGR